VSRERERVMRSADKRERGAGREEGLEEAREVNSMSSFSSILSANSFCSAVVIAVHELKVTSVPFSVASTPSSSSISTYSSLLKSSATVMMASTIANAKSSDSMEGLSSKGFERNGIERNARGMVSLPRGVINVRSVCGFDERREEDRRGWQRRGEERLGCGFAMALLPERQGCGFDERREEDGRGEEMSGTGAGLPRLFFRRGQGCGFDERREEDGSGEEMPGCKFATALPER